MIKVRNLHKYFGKLHVLKGVSLEVEQGGVLVLIGPSGSGKSTLLRCVNFLEEYEEGEVYFEGKLVGYQERGDGRRIRDSESRIIKLRSQMGMVFQTFNLFPHKTVLENVMEGPVVVQRVGAKEARNRAVEILRKVGLEEKLGSYPSTLSGGQQQRCGIARALAMQPKVMLFDEPTSSLDPELVGEVLIVMKDLANEGMTMIIATHEMSFAQEIAENVAVLEEGNIIEYGPPEQIFSSPKNARTADFLRRVTQRNVRDENANQTRKRKTASFTNGA